jgi:hypothetical protein
MGPEGWNDTEQLPDRSQNRAQPLLFIPCIIVGTISASVFIVSLRIRAL